MQMLDKPQTVMNAKTIGQPVSTSFDDIPSTPYELDDVDDLPFG